MTVIFNGISFNKEWVASKTLREFMIHEKHHLLSEGDMHEVYNLCRGKETQKDEEIKKKYSQD